jgi:hypothetical protein
MASSRLLQLPAEIRLRILEHVLFNPEPLIAKPLPCAECAKTVPRVAVYTHYFEHKNQKKTLGVYPEILASCRQLHSEGSPILYSNSVSVVFSNMSGGTFVRSLVIGHIEIMPQPGEYVDIPHGPTPVSRFKMHVTLKIEGDNEVLDAVFAREVGSILSRSLVGLRELTIDIAINPHLLTAYTNPHLARI